ncbi:hypothetical protein EDD86DRAFT_179430, partial [Gorgonomyces haynaldii]
RIPGSDYRSWDKFDVDKALEQVDYQPLPKKDIDPFYVDNSPEDVNLIEEALVEKEKGNHYFKKGDYKKAVVCYTKSIKYNPQNVIPIINRAMCYLKLDKHLEAESDCTLALDLDNKNIKAFWRRGKARTHLAKLPEAKKDLEMALVLEPTNASIKQDL